MLAQVEGKEPAPTGEGLYVDYKSDTETLLAVNGDYDGGPLDFAARTIIVDNHSSLYVYIPAVKRYAIPATRDQVFPCNRTMHKRLRWMPPAAIAQPADNGAPVIITWLSEKYNNVKTT